MAKEEALISAIKAGDLTKCESILADKPVLSGTSLFQCLFKEDDPDTQFKIAKLLLENGAPIEKSAVGECGMGMIIDDFDTGIKMFELLCSCATDLDEETDGEHGWRLFDMINAGDFDDEQNERLLRLLIKCGANPELADDLDGEDTALMHSRTILNARLLIQYGADLSIKNRTGEIPVQVVTDEHIREYLQEQMIEKFGSASIKEIAKMSGLDIPTYSPPPERLAPKRSKKSLEASRNLLHVRFARDLSTIPTLLKKASIDFRGDDGNTCLHDAISAQVINFLLKQGADLHAINDAGNTALAERVMPDYGEEQLDAISLLLTKGSNPNLRNFRGETCLHIAAMWGASQAPATIRHG